MSSRPLNRLLVLSNGHGEDLIAQRILRALQTRQPQLVIRVLPLVGLGEAFTNDEAEGHLKRLGPQLQLPSGGFSNQSLTGLLRDLAAGVALVEQAGGVVCAYDGGPARLAEGRLIACTPALRQALIDGLAACRPLSGASFGAPELDQAAP